MPTYHLYILECKDGSLYTGITTDLPRRLREHKSGKGAHYTRAKGAVKIRYTEKEKDRSGAQRREAEIKKLARKEKIALINAYAKKNKSK